MLRPAKLWNDTESAPDAGWLVDQLEGGAAAWAERVRQRAGGGVHHRQVVVVAPQRARGVGATGRRAAAARLAHLSAHRRAGDRPGRRIRHRLLVARRRATTGGTCWRSSTGTRLVRCRAPGARPDRPRWGAHQSGRRRTGFGFRREDRRRRRHRRQHGGRSRDRSATGRRRLVTRDLGHGLRGERRSPRPTRRAQWPASQMRPDASCLWCARSTPQVSPTRWPACLASITTAARRAGAGRTGRSRRGDRAPLLRRRAHSEPARRHGSGGRATHRRQSSSNWPGRRSKGWCAACSTGSTR